LAFYVLSTSTVISRGKEETRGKLVLVKCKEKSRLFIIGGTLPASLSGTYLKKNKPVLGVCTGD